MSQQKHFMNLCFIVNIVSLKHLDESSSRWSLTTQFSFPSVGQNWLSSMFREESALSCPLESKTSVHRLPSCCVVVYIYNIYHLYNGLRSCSHFIWHGSCLLSSRFRMYSNVQTNEKPLQKDFASESCSNFPMGLFQIQRWCRSSAIRSTLTQGRGGRVKRENTLPNNIQIFNKYILARSCYCCCYYYYILWLLLFPLHFEGASRAAHARNPKTKKM